MTGRTSISLVLAATLVSAGLLGAGCFAGNGMAKLRTDDRFVTVKGSAEQDVAANLLVWPLAHSVSGNELADAAPAGRQYRDDPPILHRNRIRRGRVDPSWSRRASCWAAKAAKAAKRAGSSDPGSAADPERAKLEASSDPGSAADPERAKLEAWQAWHQSHAPRHRCRGQSPRNQAAGRLRPLPIWAL